MPITRIGDVASAAVLNNSLGIVPGGVPLHTASLRINFLRQFRSGPESRYVGTALRVGRSSGVAEAQAVGDAGKAAIIARITAYLG